MARVLVGKLFKRELSKEQFISVYEYFRELSDETGQMKHLIKEICFNLTTSVPLSHRQQL